ncbi:MAG: hypothetical protein ABI629_21175, partial [bacterium]
YAAIAARRPLDALSRVCFALDQQVVSLPAWREGGAVAIADLERSCFLAVEPFRVEICGDAATRRWRFTLQWVFHELAATRLRRTALDLHAAAVETRGAALLIVGPKGAGKTTLSFHLLRSGRCRWISNDRAFVGRSATGFDVRGMPTPVKILAPTLSRFPELRRGLRPLERLYLHVVAESIGDLDDRGGAAQTEFALSPAQVAHQLRVEALDAAPLAAIVFPEIRSDVDRWVIERLDSEEVGAKLGTNLYGRPSGRSEPTLFEEMEGGLHLPQRELAEELSASVPGYRVALGASCYTDPDFTARLLDALRR